MARQKEYWEEVLEAIRAEAKQAERDLESQQKMVRLRASWLLIALQHIKNMREALQAPGMDRVQAWDDAYVGACDFLDFMMREGMISG